MQLKLTQPHPSGPSCAADGQGARAEAGAQGQASAPVGVGPGRGTVKVLPRSSPKRAQIPWARQTVEVQALSDPQTWVASSPSAPQTAAAAPPWDLV